MKKPFLFTAILLMSFQILQAQNIITGDFGFTRQTQIDSFIIVYPNCTKIDGGVFIEEDTTRGNITGLEGLKNIKTITESLEIINNLSLSSLSGLESLDSIGGGLNIANNERLISLSGLESLKTVQGNLSIFYMNKLTDLEGLDQLTSIGECLLIGNNDKLVNFSGLDGLISIGGFMEVLFNSSLTNFSGLDALVSLGGYLKVMYNDSLINFIGLGALKIIGERTDDLRNQLTVSDNALLTDFSGLDALTYISGMLYIAYSPALTGLSGLENLDSIKGSIYIVGNDLLNNISSIENIDPKTVNARNSSYKDLQISENPQLSECAIQCICTIINDDEKSKTIQNNKTGCNYSSEIKTACSASGVHDESKYLFELYPNPAKNTLFLEYDKTLKIDHGNFNIEIYSITGQKVKTINHPVDKINLTALDEGIYIIKISTSKGSLNRKIAIAR